MPNTHAIVGPTHIAYLLHGEPGAGKSTVASLLARNAGCAVVAFDDFWGARHLTPSCASSTEKWDVYRAALAAARRELRQMDVVVDCTSRSADFRRYATLTFRAVGSRVVFLSCHAPRVAMRRRVAARWLLEPKHPSTGVQQFDAIAATFEPLDGRDSYLTIMRIDTAGSRPRLVDGYGPDARQVSAELTRAFEPHSTALDGFTWLARSSVGVWLEAIQDAMCIITKNR